MEHPDAWLFATIRPAYPQILQMPVITISLALLILVVHMLPRYGFLYSCTYSPVAIRTGEWWCMFTYIFIHRSWMHLCTNLVFLIIMGWAYETRLGESSWLLMFLFVASVAALAQLPKTFTADFTTYSGFSNVNSGLIVAALLTGDIHARGIPVSQFAMGLYFILCILNLPIHNTSIVDHKGHFFGACAGLLMYKLNLLLI